MSISLYLSKTRSCKRKSWRILKSSQKFYLCCYLNICCCFCLGSGSSYIVNFTLIIAIMKKFLFSTSLIFILSIIASLFFTLSLSAACSWSEWWSVAWQFDNCLSWTQLVDSAGDMRLDGGFRIQVMNWTTNIATLLWLLAIGGIVYGWFLMTLSAWEDEKIKKWKDIVKWSLIWFLALISASALVRIVIEFIYSVSW